MRDDVDTSGTEEDVLKRRNKSVIVLSISLSIVLAGIIMSVLSYFLLGFCMFIAPLLLSFIFWFCSWQYIERIATYNKSLSIMNNISR